MESGIYAACSALIARTQALDILANNLANVNTAGYKGETQFYEALNAASANPQQGALDAAVNQFGVLAGQELNFSPGSLQSTGNALDIALQGPGFLQVKTTAGVVYTRSGNLQESSKGVLETSQGDPVLGVDPKGKLGPIVLPSGAPSISSDGTISVNGALAGKISLVEATSNAQLTPIGNAYFAAPATDMHPAHGTSLQSGALESSNVNPIQAETDLITLQRHFDLLERAVKIFNTDFDQAAATELPRIGA